MEDSRIVGPQGGLSPDWESSASSPSAALGAGREDGVDVGLIDGSDKRSRGREEQCLSVENQVLGAEAVGTRAAWGGREREVGKATAGLCWSKKEMARQQPRL